MASDAFSTGWSLAVTRPASIAAWARARLSNSPRSTSNRSARLRGGGMLNSRTRMWPSDASGQLHRFGLEVLAERFEHLGDDALGVEAGAGIHRVRRVVIVECVGQHHRAHPQPAVEHAVLRQRLHDMGTEAADRAFFDGEQHFVLARELQ